MNGLVIASVCGLFVLIWLWAAQERRRDRAEQDAERRLLAELSRHPSCVGTEFCPYCWHPVNRCLCD